MGDKTTKDIEFVQALGALLRAEDLNEVEVERSEEGSPTLRVRLVRQTYTAPQAAPLPHPAAPPVPAATAPAAPPSAADPAPAEEPAAADDAVTSPMVGTVYLQAEPGAPSFISTGDQVKEGQTLLIIEAMKTMNHIPAPRDGTVTRILVDDGTPVEFGAPLVVLS